MGGQVEEGGVELMLSTLPSRNEALGTRRVSLAPFVLASSPALKEALIKSRMRDRGDLGRGQEGEDAV